MSQVSSDAHRGSTRADASSWFASRRLTALILPIVLCLAATPWSGGLLASDDGPFPPAALPANRSGRLTDEQARHWQEIAGEQRTGIRRMAYVAGAMGGVLLIAKGPASTSARRILVAVGFLALVPAILMVATHDALSADLREGRVVSVEGAIAKGVVHGHGSSGDSFYFDIARRRLRTSRNAYEAAPDAGIIRAYFLPRSRRVVNLERLPDRPLPTEPGAVQQLLAAMATAARSHDPVARAEARATAAAVEDAIRGPQPTEPISALQGDELYGSWTNLLMTVTFARDGTATITASSGVQRAGHWSIDANGHLLTDTTGRMEPTDAWLVGDQLTLTVDGKRLTFTRATHSR